MHISFEYIYPCSTKIRIFVSFLQKKWVVHIYMVFTMEIYKFSEWTYYRMDSCLSHVKRADLERTGWNCTIYLNEIICAFC